MPRWLRIAVIVAIAALVVVLANGTRRDPRDIRSAAIGEPAPELALARLDGTGDVRFAELRGKVVVVNFFASWCVPCRQEAPALVRAWERYRTVDVAFVSIAYQDGPGEAAAFHRAMGQTWTAVADDASRAAIAFGVFGVPETFFVSPDGIVVARHVGPIDEASLVRAIDSLRPAATR